MLLIRHAKIRSKSITYRSSYGNNYYFIDLGYYSDFTDHKKKKKKVKHTLTQELKRPELIAEINKISHID